MPVQQRAVPAVLDDVDHGILHCLQLDGRVPFRRVADLLGVSEQTVARRYARMRGAGVVRVVGLVEHDDADGTVWQVRLKARSDAVSGIAAALAARDDVSWVTIGSGGTEVLATLRAPDSAQRDDLLLRRLPSSVKVLDMQAAAVLHRFLPPGGLDFLLPSRLVPDGAGDELVVPRQRLAAGAPEVTAEDELLVAALAADGRAPAAQLGRLPGWTEARAAARLKALRASGRLWIDADIAVEAVGLRSSCHLWLTVEPRWLAAVGEALAAHPSVPFACAITGTANVMVVALLREAGELYTFMDQALGRLEGIRQVETVPVLRWVKQAGTVVEGNRLRL